MSGRISLGVLFLLFGLGFLFHQAGLIDLFGLLANWWPVILMIIGIVQLLNRKHASASSGILLLLIGFLFLLNKWVEFNVIAYIWPLIFIVIGVFIILNRMQQEKRVYTEDALNTFVLFAGAEINSQSQAFQGGTVTTILGGAEVDLRDANFVNGSSLDLMTILGGVEITVPSNVQVEISGVPIFGGWEDKTRVGKGNEEVPVLKVNCLTIFGGVEIRN